MADVVRAVLRLRQRAQQHRLQQREVRTLADAIDQLRVVHRRRLVAAGERQRRAAEELAQRRELLRRRAFVDAIQRGLLVLREKVRRADVRREHAFLDQLVRVVARRRHDPHDLAVRVELQRQLDGVEVDRAASLARGEEHLVERVELCEMRQQRACGLAFRRSGSVSHADLRVREPRARMHDRRVERVRLDRAARVDLHVARHAQPVDVRLQRAQLVRQRLGQHRNHAPRKVDRRAALARVGVERVAVAYVVADVGDRDDEPEAAAVGRAIDGVVEVLRRLAVDRHERQFGEIGATLAIGGAHLRRQPLRLALGGGAPFERQRVLAQRDLDLDARIGRAAAALP